MSWQRPAISAQISAHKENIRDQIIEGLLDSDTVEELLKEKDLSLDKTIATCRAQEAAKKTAGRDIT